MQSLDRYIPCRDKNWSQTVASYSVQSSSKRPEDLKYEPYRHMLYSACTGSDMVKRRGWLFPCTQDRSVELSRAIGSHWLTKPYLQIFEIQKKRQLDTWEPIKHTPQRILDAPEYVNDYYSSLVDVSSCGQEQLAVALGREVYIWTVNSEEASLGAEESNTEDRYSVVRWQKRPGCLLIGTVSGKVGLIDIERKITEYEVQFRDSLIHPLCAEPLGMNCVALGSKKGTIYQLDTRNPSRSCIYGDASRYGEICALRLHANNNYLASGTADNIVRVWDVRLPRVEVLKIQEHCASIKALAWSPCSSDLLFSGGGTADRTIKVTSLAAQRVLASGKQACSQITGIHLSEDGKRLASCHGFNSNSIIVWQYDGNFKKITELHGHTSRITNSVMMRDRTTLITAAADETLRFWNVFTKRKLQNEEHPTASTQESFQKFAFIKVFGSMQIR